MHLVGLLMIRILNSLSFASNLDTKVEARFVGLLSVCFIPKFVLMLHLLFNF